MIFNCGENWNTYLNRLESWHAFFALWPRRVAVKDGMNVCAWLQTIERKGKYYGEYGWSWEYRLQLGGDGSSGNG